MERTLSESTYRAVLRLCTERFLQAGAPSAFDNVKRAHLDRAKGTHPFVNGFKVNRRSRACGNCGKPSRVFQAAEEIIKKNGAEGHLTRFPRLRQFPQASPFPSSFFLVLFLSLFRFGSRGEIIRSTIVYRRRWRSGPTLSMPGIPVHDPPAAASGGYAPLFLSLLFFRLSVNRMLSQSNSWMEQ